MGFENIPAVLSVRMPAPARDRLKAAAVARGQTVQVLVGSLVEQFLAENGRQAPELAAVLRRIRSAAPRLRTRGVRSLWVSGPVARGEARLDAAVVVLCEFEPVERVSLVRLASLQTELSRCLDAAVELAERGGADNELDDAMVRAL